MLAYLRALVSRFRRIPGTFLPPEDPEIGVRQPLKPRPGGRSPAASVEEPADPTVVHAAGLLQGRDGPR